jgi:hypothetical protein
MAGGRETAGWTRNAKRNGGFGTSFYGAISGYILLRKF